MQDTTTTNTAPLKLRPYLEDYAESEGLDLEEFLLQTADSVSEGYGARDPEDEEASVQLALTTAIDPDDEKLIRDTFEREGYGERTQNIAIGGWIAAMRAQ